MTIGKLKRRDRYRKAVGQKNFCMIIKGHGEFCGPEEAVRRCERKSRKTLISLAQEAYDGYYEDQPFVDRQYWASFPTTALVMHCADGSGRGESESASQKNRRKLRRGGR